jgi:hypothetical protein
VSIELADRVARWYIFKQKILMWVNFGWSCNGRFWYILCPFVQFHSYLEYLVAIWYDLLFFVYFSRFGILSQEKSGNPACRKEKLKTTSGWILGSIL